VKRVYLILGTVALFCLLLLAPPTPTQSQGGTATPGAGPTLAPGISKQRVTFKSGDLTLIGYLFKPASASGPLPGVIWNHGSEKSPGTSAEFDAVADILVPAGYILFAPIRRGHGDSEGPYIGDQVAAERKAKGADAAAQLLVSLMEGPQLDDQLAGLAYLRGVQGVDTSRLAVIGCSYGGIQTLLGAERNPGYKAAVAESPAAESWNGNKPLQARLIKAVDNINIPVFLIQPEKDVSVSPGYVLGQEFQRLGKPYGLEIFPPFGPADEQGHCFGGAKGFHIWGADVLNFLSNTVK